MGIVKIEGKEITLDDDIIKAGEGAVRAVLAANGFPAVENSNIVMPREPGAPAVVTPRSTGKGGPGGEYDHFVNRLAAALEHVNPAITLAAQVMRAELDGDSEFFERAARAGLVERALTEGSREGRRVIKALQLMGHVVPCPSRDVPVGF